MIFINIGIDIGGSHTAMGVIDENGNVLDSKEIFYTPETFDIDECFESINDFVNEHEAEADSIGIGIPGFATDTLINYTCNLPLDDVEVTDYINTSLPIYISNDANCATIAEYEIIDRKIYSNYILVTIGTGIGAGIILNGALYTGSSGTAGEIGHMVIEKDGLSCKCGRKGCFEKYASISALKEMMGGEDLEEIFYLAEKNQKLQNVLEIYLDRLSDGLANVINMYDPEMIVLGGGLSEFQDAFLYKLKSKIISKIYNKKTYDLNIKIAELKNDAGIIGASMLEQYLQQ